MPLLDSQLRLGGRGERLRAAACGDLVGREGRTRAEGFRSPVLLDPEFSASEAFRAGGTPSAVLVDAEARVASEVLLGAEAILGRVRGPHLVHARSS